MLTATDWHMLVCSLLNLVHMTVNHVFIFGPRAFPWEMYLWLETLYILVLILVHFIFKIIAIKILFLK